MKSRNQSLDALRGIAVLMVVASHYSLVLNYDSRLLGAFRHGVDLFFVLSGFLISGLLFSEYKTHGTISLKRFWIRRGFKIYPAFYSFMLATAAGCLLIGGKIPREILGEIFFLQNYGPHFWVHSWSLAVEEHFYLLLPILLLLLGRLAKGRNSAFRVIPLLSLALSALCLYMRILAYRHGYDWNHVAFPTHLRMDALFAGVTLGYYAHFDPKSFAEAGRTWILIIGVLLAFTLLVLPSVPDLTVGYIGSAFLVAWTVNQSPSRGLLSKSLAWIGYYSYSIYLWHVMVMLCLERLPERWFRFPAYMISAMILGILMAKLIEVPSVRLRDKLFPSLACNPNGSRPESTSSQEYRPCSERLLVFVPPHLRVVKAQPAMKPNRNG